MISQSPEDDFWVVLPSNSNMSTHPDNQPNDYTVRLRRPFNLSQSDWEVAILNAQYPYNWYNFKRDLTVHFVHATDDSLHENQLQLLLPNCTDSVSSNIPSDTNDVPSDVTTGQQQAHTTRQYTVVKAVIPRANYASGEELGAKICSLFDEAYK